MIGDEDASTKPDTPGQGFWMLSEVLECLSASGDELDPELRAEAVTAAEQQLIEVCSAGRLTLLGVRSGETELQIIPTSVFAEPIWLSLFDNSIQPDPNHSEHAFVRGFRTWTRVQARASDVISLHQKSLVPQVVTTHGAKACRKELELLMQGQKTTTKATLRQHMCQKHKISERHFDRLFAEASAKSGGAWSRPGQPRRTPGRL